MNVLGIDPSLTSLGFAHTHAGKVVTGTVKTKARGPQRLHEICAAVETLASTHKINLVAYEGYAMGVPSRGGRAFDLGELGGALKVMLYRRRIPILIVPPSNLKLYATGKGNADKDAVRVAMAKHRGTFFKSDDEADAYALWCMGHAFLDRRSMPRDARHPQRRAIKGCELVGEI